METTAAAAAAAVALPDDAIEEILVRVDDPAALFRCTTVCKPWSSLVATPSFLRRRWPENSPESCSLVGFFAPEKRELGVAREQIFVPAPGSPPLGRCSLGSFYPEAARDWLEHAEPVTSRRGLLLVLLHSRVSPGGIKLAVCNPLAGTCDLLPPLDRYSSDFERDGCIILTGADLLSSKGGAQPPSPLPGYSTFFRVLLCVHQDVWGYDSERISCAYNLLMFSSDDESSSWTEPRECFKQINTRMLEMMGCAVVCRGMAYWLLKSESADYYALQASVDTGHVVSFTKLSIGLGDHEIAWFHAATNGTTLRLLRLRLRRSFLGDKIEVWTCQNGDSATDWQRTGRIKLEERPKKEKQSVGAITSFFRMIKLERPKHKPRVGTLSGTLLFCSSETRFVDLTTGAMEDVTNQFNGLDRRDAVPFEANWRDVFSSLLGGPNYLGATLAP